MALPATARSFLLDPPDGFGPAMAVFNDVPVGLLGPLTARVIAFVLYVDPRVPQARYYHEAMAAAARGWTCASR